MIIKTETELVRYIRHHIAGSEWQDVKAVKDFVEQRLEQARVLPITEFPYIEGWSREGMTEEEEREFVKARETVTFSRKPYDT